MPSWYSSIPLKKNITNVNCVRCAEIAMDQAQLDASMITEVVSPTLALTNKSLYSKAPKINSTTPVIPPAVVVVPPLQTQEFDFAVIRYRWSSTGGTDLDTRTAIMDVDSSLNGRDLGWSRYGDGGDSTGAYLGVSSSNYYMFWGGDNTSDGVESLMVDFKKISSTFSLTSPFRIRLRANWYSQRYTGNFEISVTTYKGGSMTRSSRDFVNIGGVQKFISRITKNVTGPHSSNVDGDSCGFITYDPVTKSMTFS